jgi:hypothetical protein
MPRKTRAFTDYFVSIALDTGKLLQSASSSEK